MRPTSPITVFDVFYFLTVLIFWHLTFWLLSFASGVYPFGWDYPRGDLLRGEFPRGISYGGEFSTEEDFQGKFLRREGDFLSGEFSGMNHLQRRFFRGGKTPAPLCIYHVSLSISGKNKCWTNSRCQISIQPIFKFLSSLYLSDCIYMPCKLQA